jgi:hypothetical protein
LNQLGEHGSTRSGIRIFDASWDHLGERLANTLGAQPEATKRGEL